MQFIVMMQALLSLLPLVVEAIKAVELAFPNAKAGAEKLEIVKGMVQHAYEVGNDTATTFAMVAPALDMIVKSVVAGFNRTGVFRR